jgi:hypothetical protein
MCPARLTDIRLQIYNNVRQIQRLTKTAQDPTVKPKDNGVTMRLKLAKLKQEVEDLHLEYELVLRLNDHL